MPILSLFDLAAVAFCASAGAWTALRSRLDWFGAILVGSVAAMGGGSLRDLLLGATPVYWISQPRYLAACLATATGICVFFGHRAVAPTALWITFIDSLSLGLFTVLGAQKTMALEHGNLTAVAMGVITGCIGGVLRDLMCRRTPWIFRSEFYATASLVGATVFVIVNRLGWETSALWAGLVATLMLRLAAVRWNLRLPSGMPASGAKRPMPSEKDAC